MKTGWFAYEVWKLKKLVRVTAADFKKHPFRSMADAFDAFSWAVLRALLVVIGSLSALAILGGLVEIVSHIKLGG